ncbi:Gfo/Idh/MocA family protein [Jiulongibacter sediminis]|uniref:Oxidoreductase n=1 Tax=Jiulongibacter sediminis TaxID=1605367 RepID=A0A0P7C3D4_9BACT|nr:Gfo/Idh/MocA family oxidoreductase [Jiulongibacter sediminis]KPM49146.1 oxidoreductase [Jiulongibacter sediminis]TBX26201.1 oxidoreductase [Jiulongibacter sediminis]
MNKKSNRRDFIKSGALAAGSFMIVPRHVLGKGYKAPSDKLNLASIGAGGKGYGDIVNAWNNGSENVVALCDVDLNQARRAVDKFPKAKIYRDFRELFDQQKDIDAVTISTPDHNHGVAAMTAMQNGIHVYVQKPLTHNIYEARMLTEGARKYKVVSQMGNQGASNPGQQQMIEWFKKGTIGKVNEVHIWTNRPVWPQGIPMPKGKHELPETMSSKNWDTWLGPAEYVDYDPLYHPFKWRGWWNFGTGALGDMGCHLIDPPFRVLELGYPTEVECSVGQVFLQDWVAEYIPEGCPPSSHVQVKFPKTAANNSEVKMIWSDGGIRPFHPDIIPADHPIGDNDSANGVMMMGEKGVMTCGTYGLIPKVYLNTGEILEMPEGYTGGLKNTSLPEYGHQTSWVEAVKAGFNSKEHKSLTSSFDYSGPLTETVIMGNLAIRSYQESTGGEGRGRQFAGRKKLIWDGDNMKITNYDEANKFVGRQYRDGWKLI